jgi:hypothetical protein
VDPVHFDPFDLAAKCVSPLAISGGISTIEESGLLPRELEEPIPSPCPCNTTYVSQACCDGHDGMIWEAPELKLGELRK